MSYEIKTWTYCDGWTNNSHENEQPLKFVSLREAKAEAKDMLGYLDIQANQIKIIKL
tara:strand:- start:76 stop:246 length:171 start_codon:yes stop_codon:yes gene_type:complete